MTAKSVEVPQWWSVPQAIVWIVSGSKSSAETVHPFATIASLHQLALLPGTTREGPPLSLNDAQIELMRAARSEEIRILGQRPNGRQEVIPASALKVSVLIDLNGLNECLPCIMEPRQALQPDSGRHWLRLWIRIDECMSRWPGAADVDEAPATTGEEAAPLRRAGRRREWDWDGALAHLAALANSPDGLPAVQADAERIVEKYFFDRNDGQSPALSGIRGKVSKVYDEMAHMRAQREQGRKRPGHS